MTYRKTPESSLRLVAPETRGHADRPRSGDRDEDGTAEKELSDAELVMAAREGERWAQEALFRRHLAWVDGLAYRLAVRDQDADDIVQDSFAEALDSLHRLEDPWAFRSWLRTIVIHRARRFFRRRRLRQRLGLENRYPVDPGRVVSPQAPPDVAAELRRLYSRIEAMPADLRIVLVLRRVERWTIPEIARELGVSEGTVKRRITKGARLLEDAMAGGRTT